MEENKINNPSAFPFTWDSSYNASVITEEGMSLRDYFAAHAASGILSNYSTYTGAAENIAKKAYDVAEEMLKQRQK